MHFLVDLLSRIPERIYLSKTLHLLITCDSALRMRLEARDPDRA